ncbi:nucleotidyltransferase family protein [uncultured Clostridium sp.]|uniref:nucleotidyltransferase domain-containing protein n=1 Tax=uncultured Clostridium sp. TaxID=59620 RepID=UPI0025EF6C76|nr:nucleotidyltransferase family protein [uncultured Clostridium sp.]
MNNSYNTIIDILKAYIKNEQYIIDDNVINWEDLIQKSREHQILSLIYYCIGKNNRISVPAKILERWKHEVVISALSEVKKVKKYKEIINGISNMKVEVIALKGIVLKEYYPKMEFRTMSDLDILIHEDDFQKVKDYLLKNDFIYVNDEHPVHAKFYTKDGIKVEVHWKLINNENYIADTLNFEEYIWNELIDFKCDEVKCKMLNKENFLLHLCIHMAKHLRNSGFGLRQLFDVAVFCEKEKDNIDWYVFKKKAEECGALKFSKALFILINKIFDMNISLSAAEECIFLEYDSDILLKEILSYNKLDKDRNEIWVKSSKNTSIKTFLRLLFPKIDELKTKYNYAQNNILIPIAWINRFINGLINKTKNIIKSIYRNYKFRKLIRRRKLLLNYFDL